MRMYKRAMMTSVALQVGLAMIMPELVERAYIERGYFTYGGEWLVMWGAVIVMMCMMMWEQGGNENEQE